MHEPNRPAMGLAYLAIGTVTVVALLAGLVVVAFATAPRPSTGRALRVARLAVAARAVDVEGWDAELPSRESPAPSPEVRRALARLWTETARSEHASVPAFSRLSLSLVALGAPARLVEAAHRAALEEIEHARLAFSLASTYAGSPVGPGRLLALHAARAVTASSLAALAAESLIDGCLLEGVAADVAQQAFARARDDRARAALAGDRSRRGVARRARLGGGPLVLRSGRRSGAAPPAGRAREGTDLGPFAADSSRSRGRARRPRLAGPDSLG